MSSMSKPHLKWKMRSVKDKEEPCTYAHTKQPNNRKKKRLPPGLLIKETRRWDSMTMRSHKIRTTPKRLFQIEKKEKDGETGDSFHVIAAYNEISSESSSVPT